MNKVGIATLIHTTTRWQQIVYPVPPWLSTGHSEFCSLDIGGDITIGNC